MKIDLSDFDSGSRSFDEELLLEPDDLDVPQVGSELCVHLRGTLTPLAVGFNLEGDVNCRGKLVCSRCLELAPWSFEEHFEVQLNRAQHAPEGDEVGLDEEDLGVAFLEEECLDLSRLAAEQVLLAMPMRVVCQENCAGLCPRCGGNRNVEDSCSCEAEVDPRWESLKGLSGR